MRIPETPKDVKQLDLMKLLDAYAGGKASWFAEGLTIGPDMQQACRTLHTNLTDIVNQVFAFVLDRVNAREMDMFTMHDRRHGVKVAHLMWHIMEPERRKFLSPPEIGLLVLSAYVHDAGMALTRAEREERLAAESDLWLSLETSEEAKQAFFKLQTRLKDPTITEGQKRRAELELQQAEEALLTTDTRQRHATPERYQELLKLLADFHSADQIRIPDIERAMSFDGDSFKAKLIDICVSHNESAEALVESDRENFQLRRFPRVYPVGQANADLQFVAAALRLADILDFDRERTPPLLFHYLLPGGLSVGENISKLEWSKHLSISNWEINDAEIVFRGRCISHIVHHAIVQFCKQIEFEVSSTHASFTALDEKGKWPFVLPKTVKPQIHEEGYHYVPYSFELDDARIYRLLMGGAIYDNPLVAVRELIQNAVDACLLKDALTELHDPSIAPSKNHRVTVRYVEAGGEDASPLLIVQDTGTGMDAWLVERWFLKVGRSYYSSSDFNKTRLELRAKNLDFAPVSEFGIGFLSCFLLADRVEVETAMWEPVRGDTRKRHLTIDGPTRLIRVLEEENAGAGRFRGTKVTLHLCRGSHGDKGKAPTWDDIRKHIEWSCEELPYALHLEHAKDGNVSTVTLAPKNGIDLLPDVAQHAIRIAVHDKVSGLEGEIVLVHPGFAKKKARQQPAIVVRAESAEGDNSSMLIRGGFRIGDVPGLPVSDGEGRVFARLREKWQLTQDRRYGLVNLARSQVAEKQGLGTEVTRIWLTHLIKNRNHLPQGFMKDWDFDYPDLVGTGLNKFIFLEEFDALEIYELARQSWKRSTQAFIAPKGTKRGRKITSLEKWETGEGPPIPLFPHDNICGQLRALVLSRVVSQIRLDGVHGVWVYPPAHEWKAQLAGCRDFIRNYRRWPLFAEYDERLKDLLFFETFETYSESLNLNFRSYFEGFGDNEVNGVIDALRRVVNAKSYAEQINISEPQAKVLAKVSKINPHFIIGDGKKRWKVSELGLSS